MMAYDGRLKQETWEQGWRVALAVVSQVKGGVGWATPAVVLLEEKNRV